jgi:arylsulfatase A-like enzyme
MVSSSQKRLHALGRSVMKLPRAGILLYLLWLVVGSGNAAAQQEKPNILLVVVDDMGYSDIGAFGSEIATPTIDALADAGIKMTNFYVGPTCSPTRSMLMSGNDNHVAGLGNMNEALTPNQAGQPGYEGYLNERVISVASLLRKSGYHTYMAGKWHLGEKPEHDPSKRGFEKSFTLLEGGASHFDDEWMMYANYTPTYRENGVRTHLPPGFYSTEFYTDKTIQYIDEQSDDAPFFAYLSFTAVHDPLHLPDDWLDRYAGQYSMGYNRLRKQRLSRMKKLGIVPDSTKLGPWLQMVPRWDDLSTEQRTAEARRMELYAAMVSNIDFHMGRLIAYLENSGKIDNTLIIFFSDNGANGAEMHMYPETDEAWVERNSDNHFSNWGRRGSRIAQGAGWAQASSTPFRLFKAFIAEGGIRSPLIMSGPPLAHRGKTLDALAHVMDIAPTLLNIAGTTYPSSNDNVRLVPQRGKSMMPVLTAQANSIRGADDYLAWEFFDWHAVRTAAWKATWIREPFGVSDWQLFDMTVDPGESNDVADQYPDVIQDLADKWDVYADEVGVVPREAMEWPDN